MAGHQVRARLMGAQACVFYGAAEFSRDTDLLIVADCLIRASCSRWLENLWLIRIFLLKFVSRCATINM